LLPLPYRFVSELRAFAKVELDELQRKILERLVGQRRTTA
jgi:hypothetical protein